MYVIDERDRVVPLADMPPSSVGAPCPLVMQDEHTTVVAYYVEAPPRDWTGETVRIVDPESSAEPAALVRFRGVCATMFGPPNDEAFRGHPLADRGLGPYSASEIHESSWIRGLERMNSVHPYHRPERYASLRHFVLAFHDSTLECVAKGYDFVVASGPLDRLAAEMLSLVRGHSSTTARSRWLAIEGRVATALEEELRRELRVGHVLHGREVRAVARSGDGDDVAFEVAGAGLCVVHLTWQRQTDPRWPHVSFVERLPEHDE